MTMAGRPISGRISGRKVTTAVTMTVLVAVLVTMAVLGFSQLTAPLPGTGSSTSTGCSGAEKRVQTFLGRSEVQVSVFNAGTRKGLASTTLMKIEAAGFRAGDAGNAPSGTRVRRVRVWTTETGDPAARLVARALGRRTLVEVTRKDLGPGVDVLVGDQFTDLDPRAAERIRLTKPVKTCTQGDGG